MKNPYRDALAAIGSKRARMQNLIGREEEQSSYLYVIQFDDGLCLPEGPGAAPYELPDRALVLTVGSAPEHWPNGTVRRIGDAAKFALEKMS